MNRLSDDELIQEIKRRFDNNQKALYDLRMMTRKLEDINKRLMDSETLKSNFISNIKNELKNPITNILLLSKGLITGDFDCNEAKAVAKSIYAELFNLDFQLRNIFTAAEIEAGDIQLSIANVDVDHLIRSTIDFFNHLIEEKSLEVDYCFINKHEEIPYFKADPSKLQIVLSNLIANAIEFSPQGGSFEIKAWKHSTYLNIIVADKGPGIDEDLQSMIFERFRQLETGSSKRHRGHGLGLSICKSLIDLMNGTITVTSKVGMGTIFTLFLPEGKTEGVVNIFSEDGNEFFFEEEVERF